MVKKQAERLEAKAYWQRVAEIGRQEAQTAKLAEKQGIAPEQTQKRTPRQMQ